MNSLIDEVYKVDRDRNKKEISREESYKFDCIKLRLLSCITILLIWNKDGKFKLEDSELKFLKDFKQYYRIKPESWGMKITRIFNKYFKPNKKPIKPEFTRGEYHYWFGRVYDILLKYNPGNFFPPLIKSLSPLYGDFLFFSIRLCLMGLVSSFPIHFVHPQSLLLNPIHQVFLYNLEHYNRNLHVHNPYTHSQYHARLFL